jgi:hypothetical protein
VQYIGVLSPEWGSNHEVTVGNRPFGNVAQLKYLGTTVTNENLIQEEIIR